MAETSSNDSGFRGVFGNLSHGGSGGEDDGLYEQLWRLSAGPCVNIPSVGELVYYFPEGHMEMLGASTNQGIDQQTPRYNLPSKIRCRVMKIQLGAEQETDELYAEIILIPHPESSDAGDDQTPKSAPSAPKPKRMVHCFSKKLTARDCGAHGFLHILQNHAERCLPRLDKNKEPSTQRLVAQDLHGRKWVFDHVYYGKQKLHLFTSGWHVFVKLNSLRVGDTFIFLRGENGELRVGVRRRMRQQSNTSPSLISTNQMHFMHLGAIAIVSDAVSLGKTFTVVYTPRTSQSEFIIPCDKYMEAVNSNITVGMRFKMTFQEGPLESMSSGIIIDIDVENPRWPNSKWRSLKIQWDKQSVFSRPERVSPWEIEPFVAPPSTDSSMLVPSNSVADSTGQRYPRSTLGDNECDSSQRGTILWGGKANDGQADSGLTHMLHRRDSQFSGIKGDILTPKESTVGGETFYAMLSQEEEDINTRRITGGLELPIHHNNCGMDNWSKIKYHSPQSVTQVAETHAAEVEQEIENISDDI